MYYETTQPYAELTEEEAEYLHDSLKSVYCCMNSPMSTCLQFVTALAAEAGLSFREICDLTLSCFNFQSQFIFPPPCDEDDVPRGVQMDIEVRISFGCWMNDRAVPEDGIDGVLLHQPVRAKGSNELRNTWADPLTPDDIIHAYRKLLVGLDPEHPHAARMSRFVEADLSSFSF